GGRDARVKRRRPRALAAPASSPPLAGEGARPPCLSPQPGLIPDALTTLVHFSMSSAISLPNSAGVPGGSTLPPRSVSRCLIFGSTIAALICLLRTSITSGGVLAGTPKPIHALAS